MKEIYANANGIIAWLGQSKADLSASVTCISAITDKFEADTSQRHRQIIGPTGLNISIAEVERLNTYTASSDEIDYELVARFFSLPYFRRVW